MSENRPRTEAGRQMLSGFSGVAGYRPRRSREVVGVREAILEIESQAQTPSADELRKWMTGAARLNEGINQAFIGRLDLLDSLAESMAKYARLEKSR